MKRRTGFIIRCYIAIAFFTFLAYVVTFSSNPWLKGVVAYNLNSQSDIFPTLERYAGIFMSKKEEVPTLGFHRFLMPVDGNIIADFSESSLTGIVVQSRPGTKVIAGDIGTISAVNFKKGIGWYIDINHGNGIYSRYANIAEVKKKVGDKVRRGEILAKVAKSYSSKFFLQIFIKGKAVNPVTATLIQKGI